MTGARTKQRSRWASSGAVEGSGSAAPGAVRVTPVLPLPVRRVRGAGVATSVVPGVEFLGTPMLKEVVSPTSSVDPLPQGAEELLPPARSMSPW
jgi:hypothetical protein